MGPYDERPWLAHYRPGLVPDLAPTHATMLDMVAAAVRVAPERPAIRYFDGSLTYGELDEVTDAFAAALAARGFRPGDRLAVYAQNTPQYVLSLVAAWKAGGAAVSVNPMNRERELEYVLADSGATVLVCHPGLYADVAASVVGSTKVDTVVTTSELDFQTRDEPRLFAGVRRETPAGTENLLDLVEAHRGEPPPSVAPRPGDVAVLSYTSGTTGVPKGAMNTHRNLTFNAQACAEFTGLTGDDVILGVAPLFHITGLTCHVGMSLYGATTLVLANRFDPAVVLDAIREHRPTFTIGSITVFIALMNQQGATREDFASFRLIYSGGAPVPPSVVEAFRASFGHSIHNAYGLTESTAPTHLGPPGVEAPVDDASGALSVGVPIPSTVVRVVDDLGGEVAPGEVGELVAEGPQIVPGYWQKPEETEQSMPGGRLRTGDVGFMNPEGWFFIVDRKKDMINAAGYKVWPRDVEDVLYTHPAVREAAVVGAPDEYRGETVQAYVSLRPGEQVAGDELVTYCKQRMAAYKYPRRVEVLDELPKTTTGKILRRELRARAERDA